MLRPQERLSQQELQRRHEAVRLKMRERSLEFLLVSGIRFVAGAGYLRYLTNWAEPFAGEALLFPLSGTPIFLARTGERAHLVEHLLGLRAIAGSTGSHAAKVIQETGIKRVGLCGHKTMLAEFYLQLTGALPGVEFVEASSILDETRMIKSGEEMRWIERSADLTDVAYRRFLDLAREGGSESDVFVEVEHAVKRLGAENTYFMMSADPRPVPKFLDLACETYERGDLVLFNAEIAGPGGYFTQLQRTLSIGSPTREAESAYVVCIAALEKGVSMLHKGNKAKDVYRAISEAIDGAGYRMGLHPGHSQGLDIFERPLVDPKEETRLSAGMIIVLHPHVLMPSGGGVWIGETFVVTEEGPRPLQKSDRELKVL
jgi:Xaa-Pro aminopeptidase